MCLLQLFHTCNNIKLTLRAEAYMDNILLMCGFIITPMGALLMVHSIACSKLASTFVFCLVKKKIKIKIASWDIKYNVLLEHHELKLATVYNLKPQIS